MLMLGSKQLSMRLLFVRRSSALFLARISVPVCGKRRLTCRQALQLDALSQKGCTHQAASADTQHYEDHTYLGTNLMYKRLVPCRRQPQR